MSDATIGLDPRRVGEILGTALASEIRMARGFKECSGLSREEVEDLYQETALALLHRSYRNEEHLLRALRIGLRQRALNVHRDRRRRREILSAAAPGMQAITAAREAERGPEPQALAREDRLVVAEFLSELDPLERRLFWLASEGVRYRSAAAALGMAVNEVRNAWRGYERKRERFQVLYESGRVCGYRAVTVRALREDGVRGEELEARARAHLAACSRCRLGRHAQRPGRRITFDSAAAALLPVPTALAGAAGRRWPRAATAHRLIHSWLSGRVLGGASAKAGATVLAAAVLAGTGPGRGIATHPHTLGNHRVPARRVQSARKGKRARAVIALYAADSADEGLSRQPAPHAVSRHPAGASAEFSAER